MNEIINSVNPDTDLQNEGLDDLNLKSGTLDIDEPDAQKDVESDTQLTPEIKILKKQISDLRKESAKYRNNSKTKESEKNLLSEELERIKSELHSLQKEKIKNETIAKLNSEGCLKSDLVISDIPENVENLDSYIQKYKAENPFLFKQKKMKHGYSFKGGRAENFTPSQQMNNLIRSALGR